MADAITVHCPSCQTPFPVDPDKVPLGGVKARCSECAEVFRVEKPSDVEAPVEEAAAPSVAEAEPSFEPHDYFFEEEAGEAGEGAGEQVGEADESPGGFETDPFFAGGAETETTLPAEEEEATSGTGEEPSPSDEGAPSVESGTGVEPEIRIEPEPAPQPEPGPEAEPEPSPGAEAEPAPEPRPALEAEPHAREKPEDGVGASEAAATAPSPRPTFGNRSPEEKAQRLARVLVSDMITYNPKLYEQALQQGTLEEDFQEEIEKSWDEYVDQVGPELAEGTSHWTDALNEILARGEKRF